MSPEPIRWLRVRRALTPLGKLIARVIRWYDRLLWGDLVKPYDPFGELGEPYHGISHGAAHDKRPG